MKSQIKIPQSQDSSLNRIKNRLQELDENGWQTVRRFYRRTVGILLLFGIFFGAWAFWFEPRRLTVNPVSLELPKWPQNLENFKIVALSDLHVGSPYITLEKLQKVVQLSNEQQPDLVVLLGDYVIQDVMGGTFVAPEDFAPILKGLKAKYGVYAVLGNHDWILGGPRVAQAFENVGIPMLTNDSVEIKTPGQNFRLVGVGDFFTQHHDLKKALMNADSNQPIIVITHTPDVFLQLPSQVLLTLAGHTHGGQVNLPFLGRRVVPSNYGDRFAIGKIEENERELFVTPGIGTSIIPVRFRVPPEISVLTLQGKK